jgi:PhnB protein
MAKQNVSEQLEAMVDAILAQPSVTRVTGSPKLKALARVAASLRGLPREDFKQRLKAGLGGRKQMSSVAKPAVEARTTAAPRLTFKDAAKAIEFYKRAFGAREMFRFEVGGGIAHAEMAIGDSIFMLAEEWSEGGRFSAETLGNSPVWLSIRTGDVDAFADTAIAAGMKVKRPIQDEFYGHRDVLLADPFGYTWSVYTVKEEMSVDEMHRRMQAMTTSPETTEARPAPEERTVSRGVPFKREGFRAITPYILVPGASQFIEFLRAAFGAEEMGRVPAPGGRIMHAEVKLGDSMIEMSDGNEQYAPSPVTIHLTVPDAEAVYQAAVKAGAMSLYEPALQFFGEYEGGVRDPFGNEWYITPQAKKYSHPTVQPYLHLHGAGNMIPFLEKAFGARAEGVHKWPGGAIAHATIFIGDGQLEIDEAFRANRQTQCHLHLYVPDTDAVYAQALRAGATTIEAPNDKPYGDRTAGVRDAWGNSWFIATHVRDVKS